MRPSLQAMRAITVAMLVVDIVSASLGLLAVLPDATGPDRGGFLPVKEYSQIYVRVDVALALMGFGAIALLVTKHRRGIVVFSLIVGVLVALGGIWADKASPFMPAIALAGMNVIIAIIAASSQPGLIQGPQAKA